MASVAGKSNIPSGHVFFCAGTASDITEDSYRNCVRPGGKRLRSDMLGFKLTCYLLHIVLSHPEYKIAAQMGRARSSIGKYISDIEDLREQFAAFDVKLESGERLVEAQFAAVQKEVA